MDKLQTIHQLFPTCIVEAYFPIPSGVLDEFKKENFGVLTDNYLYGHETVDKFILNQPKYTAIKIQVENELNSYLYEGLNVDPEYSKCQLESSWINIHKPGDMAQEHVHHNSCFSGVWYLQTNETSGDINWVQEELANFPFSQVPRIKKVNEWNTTTFHIQPKNGTLVFFPSTLRHGVDVNESKEDRYSLAMNFSLRGTFGMGGGQVKYD